MKEYSAKSNEAIKVAYGEGTGSFALRLQNNRPEAVSQLRAQELASASSRARQAEQLQSVAKRFATLPSLPVQRIAEKPVQRVTGTGGFSPNITMGGVVLVPAGAHRADMRLVLDNLARIPATQIQDIENRMNAPITISTGNVGGGDLAETIFEVYVSGNWRNLDDICDPASANYHLGLKLDRDTPVRISIVVDDTLHNIAPNNHQVAATLVHEITVHLTHIHPWLEALRGGVYEGVSIRSRWRVSGVEGGLATPDREHDTFGEGSNRSYNDSVSNIYTALGVGGANFRADIRADMVAHYVGGGAPNYPI